MKHKIMSIYDAKAEAFLPLWTVPTEGIATREFCNMAQNEDSNVGAHPEDYILYCLGEWSDKDCKMELHTPPKMVMHAMVAAGKDDILKDVDTAERLDSVELKSI